MGIDGGSLMDWLLLQKDQKCSEIKRFKANFNNLHYSLYHELSNDEYFANKEQGIFIFGYIITRLNEKEFGNSPKQILKCYNKFGEDFIKKYKGIFTLIIFDGDTVKVFTDRFGISKFFYHNENDSMIASNRLELLKNNLKLEISIENVYLYLIFNYYVEDTTLFANLYKSEGANIFTLIDNINKKKYFDSYNFLNNSCKILSKKETFKEAPKFWKRLMKQYLDYSGTDKVTQTLTAGLDSRMILAGFRSNGFNPDTFTFGNSQSMDVVYAKKISRKLGIKHNHFVGDDIFFNNFKTYAKEVLSLGDGLISLFRAHRLDCYNKVKENYDTIYFGFIGSEITRGGVYPDGLIFPWIVIDKWLNKNVDTSTYLKENYIDIDPTILKRVEKRINNFSFMNNPDQYIFDVLIPQHFGQDIRLLERLDTKSISPFWDIDFLEFQQSTPYFIDNSKKENFSKLGHFKRRRGPYYSTRIVSILDKENAKISLGKGYSPLDYQKSMYLAGIKFLYYKNILIEQYIPI